MARATVGGRTTYWCPGGAGLAAGRRSGIIPGMARRVALVAAMVLVTLNIWTGGPLLALWIGSRLDRSAQPSMGAIAAVAVALGVISYALVRLLARLEAVYARLTGRPSTVRRHVPWLRSMRGERPHQDARAPGAVPARGRARHERRGRRGAVRDLVLLLLDVADRRAQRALARSSRR